MATVTLLLVTCVLCGIVIIYKELEELQELLIKYLVNLAQLEDEINDLRAYLEIDNNDQKQ